MTCMELYMILGYGSQQISTRDCNQTLKKSLNFEVYWYFLEFQIHLFHQDQ